MTDFSHFGLQRPIMAALERAGHKTPTPIQKQAISPVMQGRDLLGIAQTGTGKTAAFALPILHRLTEAPAPLRAGQARVLVLAPTRELAAQVLEAFRTYGAGLRLKTALVIGGASINKQKAAMRGGVDILVATPGRLVDLMEQGAVSLSGVGVFVLDEVDQMLDLGFIHAIRAIAAKLPSRRQNLFFSATMPPAISKLASSLLKDPVRAEVPPVERLKIEESVMFLEKNAKPGALLSIVKRQGFTRGLVFTRTKHGADKVVRTLAAAGEPAFAIHGNRSQGQRERALDAFRSGKARILVATDIAARGIDVAGVSHVVNYDLPNVAETYVHRIGRTARAGAAGVAISFCSQEERPNLKAIERLTQQKIAFAKAPDGALANERPIVKNGANPNTNSGAKHRGPKPYPREPRRSDNRAEPAHAIDALLPFLQEAGPAKTHAHDTKGKHHGERGTARIRRRRHRGSAGRELSRAAG